METLSLSAEGIRGRGKRKGHPALPDGCLVPQGISGVHRENLCYPGQGEEWIHSGRHCAEPVILRREYYSVWLASLADGRRKSDPSRFPAVCGDCSGI